MPAVLEVMALYNRIVRSFDVTPGSQITWVTCSGLVNRYAKERGDAGVAHLIRLLTTFVEELGQDLDALGDEDREELLTLFRGAPGDFKNLLLGAYGKLPVGWPADWVYASASGDEAERRLAARREDSPLESVPDEDLAVQRRLCAEQLGRAPNEEEFILWLMHPKDALDFIAWRNLRNSIPRR